MQGNTYMYVFHFHFLMVLQLCVRARKKLGTKSSTLVTGAHWASICCCARKRPRSEIEKLSPKLILQYMQCCCWRWRLNSMFHDVTPIVCLLTFYPHVFTMHTQVDFCYANSLEGHFKGVYC